LKEFDTSIVTVVQFLKPLDKLLAKYHILLTKKSGYFIIMEETLIEGILIQ
jgi:hypothetical protein